jgi:hypothetical protein
LENIFFNATNKQQQADQIIKALSAKSNAEAYLNLENLNPADKKQLENVALSPISVVHLFRQYFFELDTFLGTSVGHVWLRPGASVELIENNDQKNSNREDIRDIR